MNHFFIKQTKPRCRAVMNTSGNSYDRCILEENHQQDCHKMIGPSKTEWTINKQSFEYLAESDKQSNDIPRHYWTVLQ